MAGSRWLVFLHGAGGSALHWGLEVRRMRAMGHRAVALDFPGHGRALPPGRSTIADYARWTAEELARRGVSRSVLVGHSMGGGVALTLALAEDLPCDGLVLVGSGVRLRVDPVLLRKLADDPLGAARMIVDMCYASASISDKRIALRRLSEIGSGIVRDDFLACDAFALPSPLAKLRLPTLVAVGSLDQMTPPRHAAYLADSIPGAVLRVVDGCGHMLMLERPDEFNRLLEEFLEGLP